MRAVDVEFRGKRAAKEAKDSQILPALVSIIYIHVALYMWRYFLCPLYVCVCVCVFVGKAESGSKEICKDWKTWL